MRAIVIPVLLALSFVIDAQEQGRRRPVPPDVSSAGVTREPVVLGATPRLFCVQNILDQATGGCLQASSVPTFGMLFPYPGTNNVFDPANEAFVGGGENNQATAQFATVAGGRNNTAGGAWATVGGGSDNRVSAGSATIGGGDTNTASGEYTTVGGGSNNMASGYTATIGGGYNNEASGANATVGGGGYNVAAGAFSTVGGGRQNMFLEEYATIGGGYNNTAFGRYASVGGGENNSASAAGATVAGGNNNRASQYAACGGGNTNYAFAFGSTIAGGLLNQTGGLGASTVGGGSQNTATGIGATVPGGESNMAQGNTSFAAGRRALANHDGSFVWGDSFVDANPSLKVSSVPDEFNVYCSGGARFFSNSAATTGVLLAPGGSTWTMASDRNAKENLEPVDTRAVLEKVAAIPISTWNYKDQSDSVRHMGPMAQDFYAAFGLGLGDKTIDTIDPNGVALAAIQGLHAEVTELRAENRELRERLERLETAATD